MHVPRVGSRCFLVAVALVAGSTRAPAQNMLHNPGFDANLDGWPTDVGPSVFLTAWSPEDVAGSPGSGSVDEANSWASGALAGVAQCRPVTAGAHLDAGAWVQVPDPAVAGNVYFQVVWYPTLDCVGADLGFPRLGPLTFTDGRWHLLQLLNLAVPVGALRAKVELATHLSADSGTYRARFDDARLCPTGTCALQLGAKITAPAFPDFEFQVTLEGGGTAIPGAPVLDCLPETVCVSGAVPGRTEVELRVIGPRPNGFLWLQAVRFTPSRVVLRVRQISTGVVREYVMAAVGPDDTPTNLEDRTAFAP